MRKVLLVVLILVSLNVFGQQMNDDDIILSHILSLQINEDTDITKGHAKEYEQKVIILPIRSRAGVPYPRDYRIFFMFNTYKKHKGDYEQLYKYISEWAEEAELDFYDVKSESVNRFDEYGSKVIEAMILYNKDIALCIHSFGFSMDYPYTMIEIFRWDKSDNNFVLSQINFIDRRRIREEFGIGE